MLELLLGSAIVLIIACLIVRDQIEFRIGRLRAELMGLRTDEKRLADLRIEVENMVAQAGEALLRTERRQRVMEGGYKELVEMLKELHLKLREEELVLATEEEIEGAGQNASSAENP